jgi:hypothetical protein
MNLADTFRVLLRRWYLTLPAIILALAAALFAFVNIKPTYDRTASLLLLPGASSIPAKSNPYLYLTGLSPVADVLTRAAASQEFLDQATGEVKTNDITISRDATTSSPVVTIQASSESDATAAAMLKATVAHVTETLDSIQQHEGIVARDRVTLQTLSMDTVGTPVQKTRFLTTGVIAVVGLLLAVVIPAAVEGASRRPGHRARTEGNNAKDAESAKDAENAASTRSRRTEPDEADEPPRPEVPALTAPDVVVPVEARGESGRVGADTVPVPLAPSDPVPERTH